MAIRELQFHMRVFAILAFAVVGCGALLLVPSIPQDPTYHHFADRRAGLGIPNFLNVISNVPFAIVGALGLPFLLSKRKLDSAGLFREPGERWPYVVFFGGVALVSVGSAYYHLAPGNARLVWDRLPMTVSFMALLDALIIERISLKAGLRLLVPLLAAGIVSVFHWHLSELRGAGDLRLYVCVQFLPMLIIPLLILLFPPKYIRGQDLLTVIGCYALSKVCELLDEEIFALGGWVSGHTLKHLVAALATGVLLCSLMKPRMNADGLK